MVAWMRKGSKFVLLGVCLALAWAAMPRARGEYYAVVAGISDYPGFINDLNFCDDDARDMVAALTRRPNWKTDNIILLLDSQVTIGGIQSAIASMDARMDGDDTFLFFYSGHGTAEPDEPPYDESDGLDEYLYVYDGLLRDDVLSDWLDALRPNRVIVMLDSCFSGGMVRGQKGVKTIGGTKAISRAGDGFARDLSRLTGIVVLTASEADESSYEFGFLRNGLFTFLATLTMNRFADANNNDLLSAEEVYDGVWRFGRLLNRVGQHPTLYDSYPASNPSAGELTLLAR
jgi:hypothetical protein